MSPSKTRANEAERMPTTNDIVLSMSPARKKSHYFLRQTKKLKYTLTNFCSNLGETETNKEIDGAFSVWQNVFGLSFQKTSENHEIKISLLNDHDNTIDCP